MKFLVLGAGKMGYAVVYDLIRSPKVERILLADQDAQQIERAMSSFVDERVVPCQMDISNFEEVTTLMSGCDVAISCITYKYNYDLAKAALEAGTSFVDLGGNEEIVRKELFLDEFARERGITLIPDCGLAPGLVSILAAAGAEGMDELYEIRLRVGGLPVEPEPPMNYAQVFSVHGLINEYMEPTTVIRSRKIQVVPSLEDVEEIVFPAPFGKLEAFNTSGGISTLPGTFEGRVENMDYKTIRYPGHCAQMRLLRDLGLFDQEEIKVGKAKLVPRDLMCQVLSEKLPKDQPDVVLLRVTVIGMKEKKPVEVVWECIDYGEEATGLSAMMRMTAFPASILAQMIARGDISEKGALVQEKWVPAKLFLAELASRGIRLSLLEREPVA